MEISAPLVVRGVCLPKVFSSANWMFLEINLTKRFHEDQVAKAHVMVDYHRTYLPYLARHAQVALM